MRHRSIPKRTAHSGSRPTVSSVARGGRSPRQATWCSRNCSRGHQVEFHAIEGFVEPEGLIGRPGFTYVPTTIRPVRGLARDRGRDSRAQARRADARATHSSQMRSTSAAIARVLARRHTENPFDALLVLGTLAPFRVPGLPCVSWPQGPPDTEWQALQANGANPEIRRTRPLRGPSRPVCPQVPGLPPAGSLLGHPRVRQPVGVRGLGTLGRGSRAPASRPVSLRPRRPPTARTHRRASASHALPLARPDRAQEAPWI